MKTVVVIGAGGRVGRSLCAALMNERIRLILIDKMPELQLSGLITRTMIDRQLQHFPMHAKVTIKGDFDCHHVAEMAEFFNEVQPDIVVNYAIGFTWDATKALSNYAKISSAGLGAFTAIQAVSPKLIAEALYEAKVNPHFVVGNLPDITIPLLHACHQSHPLVKPVCGAGNVGLIKHAVLTELKRNPDFQHAPISLDLVAHHLHWVAPREPGYRQNLPFLLRVKFDEQDITDSLGDPRDLMNQSIMNCYEAGDGFSSTTGLLAYRVVKALLSDTMSTRMHVPGPNGREGGMPCLISSDGVQVDLPKEWDDQTVQRTMLLAQKADGVANIFPGGTIQFTTLARKVLKEETGFDMPAEVAPSELIEVAKAQIECTMKRSPSTVN